jgi:soluble lytic murein transglycosylase
MRYLSLSFLISLAFALCVISQTAKAETKSQNFRAQGPSVETSTSASNPGKTWLYYYDDQGPVEFSRLSAFIGKHPDFPAMRKLTLLAERAMPSSLSNQKILEWFSKYPPRSFNGMILYARALEQTGQGKALRPIIQDWWSKADLSRDEQRQGYTKFQGLIDAKTHDARMRALIYEGAYTNARAIASVLGTGHQALAEARIALRTGKGNPDALIKKIPSSLLNDEGLLFDWLQLRRKNKNNAGAIEILRAMPSESKLHDADDWGKERGIIIRRLFELKQYKQAYTLASSHGLSTGPGFAQNEWMAGWLAYRYLNANRVVPIGRDWQA